MAATSPGTEIPASLKAVRMQLALADNARAQAAEAHVKAAILARALQHSLSRTAAARARGRVVLGLSSSAQCRVNAGAATPPATGECSSDCAPSSWRRTLGQLQPQSEWSPGLAAAGLRKRSLQPAFSS